MRTIFAAIIAAMLAACGGGGDSTPAQECKSVSNIGSTLVDATGKVITAGAITTFNLCCSKGFTTTVGANVVNQDGTTLQGAITTSCTP